MVSIYWIPSHALLRNLTPNSCTPHLTGSKGSAEQQVQPVGSQLLVGFPCPACEVLQQVPCLLHLSAPFLAAVLPTDRREGCLHKIDMHILLEKGKGDVL